MVSLLHVDFGSPQSLAKILLCARSIDTEKAFAQIRLETRADQSPLYALRHIFR
jgi:hypothetical protein